MMKNKKKEDNSKNSKLSLNPFEIVILKSSEYFGFCKKNCFSKANNYANRNNFLENKLDVIYYIKNMSLLEEIIEDKKKVPKEEIAQKYKSHKPYYEKVEIN